MDTNYLIQYFNMLAFNKAFVEALQLHHKNQLAGNRKSDNDNGKQ